jgi:hypothetical protein
MADSSNVHALVTNRSSYFRCPVCSRVEPRYNSIIICCYGRAGPRDRTICVDCAIVISQAMAQLHEDDKGEEPQ